MKTNVHGGNQACSFIKTLLWVLNRFHKKLLNHFQGQHSQWPPGPTATKHWQIGDRISKCEALEDTLNYIQIIAHEFKIYHNKHFDKSILLRLICT